MHGLFIDSILFAKNKIRSTKITMNLVAYNPGPATWDHKPSQAITQNHIVTYILKVLKHQIIKLHHDCFEMLLMVKQS